MKHCVDIMFQTWIVNGQCFESCDELKTSDELRRSDKHKIRHYTLCIFFFGWIRKTNG